MKLCHQRSTWQCDLISIWKCHLPSQSLVFLSLRCRERTLLARVCPSLLTPGLNNTMTSGISSLARQKLTGFGKEMELWHIIDGFYFVTKYSWSWSDIEVDRKWWIKVKYRVSKSCANVMELVVDEEPKISVTSPDQFCWQNFTLIFWSKLETSLCT